MQVTRNDQTLYKSTLYFLDMEFACPFLSLKAVTFLHMICPTFSLLAFLLSETHEKGYCSFPGFLWAPLPDSSNRKWFTRTEYVRNSNTWERQREIIVEETEMIVHHRYGFTVGYFYLFIIYFLFIYYLCDNNREH